MVKTQTRPKNAYNFYCQNSKDKEEIREQHPDWSGVEILKELAKKWSSLSKEDKQPYEQQAQEAKEEFSKQEGGDSFLIIEEKVKKRPRSAYILYSYNAEVRNKIKTEHPDWKVTQIASHLGKMWNSMSDKDRKKWVELSLKEKANLEASPVWKVVKKKKKQVESSSDSRISQLEQLVHQLSNEIKNIKNQLENSS